MGLKKLDLERQFLQLNMASVKYTFRMLWIIYFWHQGNPLLKNISTIYIFPMIENGSRFKSSLSISNLELGEVILKPTIDIIQVNPNG